MADYQIQGVEVTLDTGIKVVAEVKTLDAIRELRQDIVEAGLGTPIPMVKKGNGGQRQPLPDDPLPRLEIRAGLADGTIARHRILAFKDEIPQLLNPGKFSNVTDAVLILLFAIENGLGQSSIEYEAFSGLYDAQNLKSGTPLSMMATNLRNAGYLDKRVYSEGRRLRLTAKGEERAKEVLRDLTENPSV